MRSGRDYLAALGDGRKVYLDGAPVADVAASPAFAPIADTIAELFDIAADPASGMLFDSPQTDQPANRVFAQAHSRDDLTARRAAITRWARHTHGWIGRSPDHVGSFLAAFAAHPEAFKTATHDQGEAVQTFYQRLLAENLYVSYAIIPPQASRIASATAWHGDFIQVGVVDEDSDGITVRGAQMLATGGAVCDVIFVSCIKPLTDNDRDFAISFVVPAATPGLRLYCRRPYATAVTSSFDYPLSARYDETDALVVFDSVRVPWERVFVVRDVEALRRQFFATGAHVAGNWQAQIRFSVKLQFLAGLAHKVATMNGVAALPGVVEKLGELASLTALVESSVLAAEYTAAPDDAGQWLPGRRALYGAMGLQAELYPRVLALLRDLAGGGVLQLPSSVDDLTSAQTRDDLTRYLQSPGTASEERVKLFRLVWDAVGSEFAGRHHQYEMFYAGAPFVAKGYAMRNYGFDEPVSDVEKFLNSYGIDDVSAARGSR